MSDSVSGSAGCVDKNSSYDAMKLISTLQIPFAGGRVQNSSSIYLQGLYAYLFLSSYDSISNRPRYIAIQENWLFQESYG